MFTMGKTHPPTDEGQVPKMRGQTLLLWPWPRPLILGIPGPWGFTLHYQMSHTIYYYSTTLPSNNRSWREWALRTYLAFSIEKLFFFILLLLHLLLIMLRWGTTLFSLSQVHSLGKNMGAISAEPKLNVVEKRWAWVASSINFQVKLEQHLVWWTKTMC